MSILKSGWTISFITSHQPLPTHKGGNGYVAYPAPVVVRNSGTCPHGSPTRECLPRTLFRSRSSLASGVPLYFFSRNERGNRAESMEIDFLLARSKLAAKNNVIPIEVKCGSRLSHKSLDKFRNRYAEWLSPPYLLSMHDVKVEGGIVFLPLYMSGLLSS